MRLLDEGFLRAPVADPRGGLDVIQRCTAEPRNLLGPLVGAKEEVTRDHPRVLGWVFGAEIEPFFAIRGLALGAALAAVGHVAAPGFPAVLKGGEV